MQFVQQLWKPCTRSRRISDSQLLNNGSNKMTHSSEIYLNKVGMGHVSVRTVTTAQFSSVQVLKTNLWTQEFYNSKWIWLVFY